MANSIGYYFHCANEMNAHMLVHKGIDRSNNKKVALNNNEHEEAGEK